ncbi:MAG: DUF3772 domain-containing protein, partial [Pseudomonadota bacterium]
MIIRPMNLRRSPLRAALFACLLLTAFAYFGSALAQNAQQADEAVSLRPAAEITADINSELSALESAQTALASTPDSDLGDLSAAVSTARTDIQALVSEAMAARDQVREALDALKTSQNNASPTTAEGDDPALAPEQNGAVVSDTSASNAKLSAEIKAAEALLSERETGLSTAEDALSRADRLLADVAAADRLNALQTGAERRRAQIEDAHTRLNQSDPPPDFLMLREELRNIRQRAEIEIEPLRETRDNLQEDLGRLGPAPEGEGAAEAPELAAERERLTLLLVREDAIIRQSALNIAEANRLLDEIASLRRERFYDEIFKKGPTPFSTSSWAVAGASVLAGFNEASEQFTQWRADVIGGDGTLRSLGLIALSVLVGILLFGPVRLWTNKRILDQIYASEPTAGRRAAAAVARIFARAVPGLLAGAIVIETLKSQGFVGAETAPLIREIWLAIVALLIVDAGATATFAPLTPGWRLVPLNPVRAQIIRAGLLVLVLLFFLDRIVTVCAQLFGATQEFALIESALHSVMTAAALFGLTNPSLWRLAEGREDAVDDDDKRVWRNARILLRLTSFAIIGAAVFGYVSFAHYISTRIILLGGLLSAGLFLRLLCHEAIRALDSGATETSASSASSEANDSSETQERLILFWIGAFVDLVIVLALAPVAFLILGAEWPDVRDAIRDLFFSFEVGSVRISIAEILLAISVFAAVLATTRFVQRTAEKRFLPRTRLDVGVRNSLKTLLGYLGLVIAVMSSISILGFNLSNLAIIAGALSVGIGFGLQSIVNNFVSGLILLFERPIKVGDWIVTTSGEGIVKRISVRSTEIETFDRSSVIVPNSELISGAVTNWTHKDKIGRIIIPVGVSYDSDPEEVIKLLEEVAAESPDMMRYPAPYVYFDDFGDSSLNLQLRGFTRDIGNS